MGKYSVNGDLIAQGINIAVRIDTDDEAGSNPQVIALVQDVNIRKVISLQRGNYSNPRKRQTQEGIF